MSLKHAILGFLSLKPLTGYDLKKAFDQSVSHFWPANQSQIYRTLAELDADGLVEKEVIAREERLDMKRYSITEQGRQALRQWLSTPLPTQETREPLLIQVFFAGMLADSELLPVLEHHLRDIEAQVAFFGELYRASLAQVPADAPSRASFLSLLTLEYALGTFAQARDWLRSAIGRLKAGDYTPADVSTLVAPRA